MNRSGFSWPDDLCSSGAYCEIGNLLDGGADTSFQRRRRKRLVHNRRELVDRLARQQLCRVGFARYQDDGQRLGNLVQDSRELAAIAIGQVPVGHDRNRRQGARDGERAGYIAGFVDLLTGSFQNGTCETTSEFIVINE